MPIIARLLSVEQINAKLTKSGYTVVKYVKVNGEFRFVEIIDGPEHRQMITPNETAQSAGFVTIDREGNYAKAYGNSMSLSLEPAPEDSNLIKGIFL